MSECYQFKSEDYALLEAAAVLLRRAAAAGITKAAELVSIAKLQHVLAALPRVTAGINVTVSVVSPRRKFDEIETFHWWGISVEDECLTISSGGHFYRPTTGGDGFSTMRWTAIPEEAAELEDYRESLWMVPDVCSFADGVAKIDLSSPGFKVEVTDDDNSLLEEEEEVDENSDDEIVEDNDEEQGDLFHAGAFDNPTDHSPMDDCLEARFNERALTLMAEGRMDEAEALLEHAVDGMPPGWKPVNETASFVQIAFWDRDEFFAHTKYVTSRPLEKIIMWVVGSYSHAWHILAVLASKQKRFDQALFRLDCGLQLEPDHPEHWSEKGFVLGQLGRHKEALECYVRAATVRAWAPAQQIARALRGQGVQLVDLQRLDEAEGVLQRSLEFEPDSEVASGELEYGRQLRERQAKAKEELPWFLRALAEPPTDPLTIQLMALVEGLPPIPGPKTVGSENYSRISHAFLERGWPGFEEEFGRIAHRSPADYEQVKRDLLREPIFSAKAHRNLARGLAAHMGISDESFDDVMHDILGNHEDPKPQ